MKFTISKQVFLDGLRQVASVVSSKTTLPILSNVKIEAENGQVRFTATDLDVCITGVVPANVLREGTVTLPAKKLVSIISELPEAEVQVDVNQRNQATVECGRSQFKLNGLPADEFPELPSFEQATVYQVDQNLLRDCIRRTEYAISTDTTRYVLNGISLSFRNGKMTLVAWPWRKPPWNSRKNSNWTPFCPPRPLVNSAAFWMKWGPSPYGSPATKPLLKSMIRC